MRFASQLLRASTAVGLASLTAACFIPPSPLAPRPDEVAQGAPDVAFVNVGPQPAGAPGSALVYSLTRNAYTAMFGVDHLGRVRVLSPGSPSGETLLEGGRAYLVPSLIDITTRDVRVSNREYDQVPYVFVLTSDTPFDLRAFGEGKSWDRMLRTRVIDPDSTIAAVAARVLPTSPDYGFDYSYVSPWLRGAEQSFVSSCLRPAADVHDYGYYRDLWAVFTPDDQRLSVNPYWFFTPALGWSSYATLPLIAYRASFAPTVFYGSCSGPGSGFSPGSAFGYRYGYAGWGYVPFGFAGGYWNPWVNAGAAVVPAPRLAPVTSLRIPVTPLALASAQVTGNAPRPNAPQAGEPQGGVVQGGTIQGSGLVGGRALSWRTLDGTRTPGEVQRPGVAAITGMALDGQRVGTGPGSWRSEWHGGARPADRPEAVTGRFQAPEGRRFEHQPSSFGSSVTGAQPRWTPRAEAPRPDMGSRPAYNPPSAPAVSAPSAPIAPPSSGPRAVSPPSASAPVASQRAQ